MKQSMGLTDFGLLAGLALMWGSSFLLTKIALQSIPPLTLVTFRMAISLIFLLVYLAVRGGRLPPPGRVWGAFLFMSLFNGVIPYWLISWGQLHIDSGLAAILNSVMPLFALVLAHFFTSDERITPTSLTGIAIGFAGVIVLVGPDALAGFGLHLLGQLAVVGGVFCYALSAVYGKRLSHYPAIIPATGMQICSTLILLPIDATFQPPWDLSPTTLSLMALVASGTFSTGLAYLVYFRLLARVGATRTALVNYLIPLVGVFWGTLLLGEHLPWRAAPALVLILTGIVFTGGHFHWSGRKMTDTHTSS